MSNDPLSTTEWIRGITIRQPWTTCILTGDKTIENRPAPGLGLAWVVSAAYDQPVHVKDKLDLRTIGPPPLNRGRLRLWEPTPAPAPVAGSRLQLPRCDVDA